jgi:manganese/zinc/iron transport system permease protein
VLTIFFGIGMMLLSVIQRSPNGNQSGLDQFLFGQAASMVGSDVRVMAVIAAVLCGSVLLLFKEFKLLAFDPGFGAGLGLPMGVLDLILNLLIVLAVVIGLQAVGVILMAALLITPAIAARYWTDRLHWMVLLAGVFGAVSGGLGTLLSQAGPRMPTGPLIVLSATAIFLLSLGMAPRRGLLARLVKHLSLRRRIARENALRAIYELVEEAGVVTNAVTSEQLRRRRGLVDRRLTAQLEGLAKEGLLQWGPGGWSLTPGGLSEAYRLVEEQRLWEVYLMHQMELGNRQIDLEGGRFPSTVRTELEGLLDLHGLRPRLVPVGWKEGA